LASITSLISYALPSTLKLESAAPPLIDTFCAPQASAVLSKNFLAPAQHLWRCPAITSPKEKAPIICGKCEPN
jgi:hypothetical protein